MLELLECCSDNFISVQAAEEAFANSFQGSQIRKLFSRLIVEAIYKDGTHDLTDFDCLEGQSGYTSELMDVLQEFRDHP